MTDTDTTAIAPFRAALHAQGRPRVWSLVVTILGDVGYPRGGWMSMTDLQKIVTDLGLEPGALRTAMSRLSGDGWVERRKKGRNSWYRLGKGHEAEFLSASAAVYAKTGATHDGPWTLSVQPPGTNTDAEGWCLRPGVFLTPTCAQMPSGQKDLSLTAVGEITTLPAWAREIIAPPDHAARLSAFLSRLSGITPDRSARLAPDQAMALRVLMIHDWRRLVLRHPSVPASLAPDEWPEAACRTRVSSLYPVLFGLCENSTCPDRFSA